MKTLAWKTFLENHFIWIFITFFGLGYGANEAVIRVTENVRITQTQYQEYQHLKQDYPILKKQLDDKTAEIANMKLISVVISSPIDGKRFSVEEAAKGISFKVDVNNNVWSDRHLWIAVKPEGTNLWYPQEKINLKAGEFTTKVYFGKDTGKDEIHIVEANDAANTEWRTYLQTVQNTGKYPNKPIPDGAFSLAKVQIVRE
ncbi:MAG TPA: hypothetical protein IGS52_10050 [Oscillatoriaceae cyanobacterium M33_DOE_052]|uniref:Uncharacterized protein n=1 Tax=Planktothricoides sp. SpSt-374 TaxID=2282167 RepID=A0A7C3ZG52_9CYAN|nr:hypothetical protein [Oscillatoriaceae cyanobacterium M33_DOE_052]